MHVDLSFLRIGVLAGAATATMLTSYAVASAPSRIASRLGIRGMRRRRALADKGLWAEIEPLVRWMGVRIAGLVSESLQAKLDRQLTLAGDYLGIVASEYIALAVLTAFGGLGFGFATAGITRASGLVILGITAFAATLPFMKIVELGQKRIGEVNRRLPYAVDVLALAMSAGLDFPAALRQFVEKSGVPDDPVVEELTLMLHEIGLGKTRAQALAMLADRVPAESAIELASTVKQAEERGNPVADVLLTQAQVSRQRRTVQIEEAASKAANKLLLPLALLFGCIFILMLAPIVIKLIEIKAF